MLELLVGVCFAGALGACLGSFANVLIIRWHEGSSMLGRSACPHCKHQIRAHHLVPVLSWLLLRGRCPDCHKAIHAQYPIVEALGAAIGVIVAFRAPPFSIESGPHFWFELILLCAMLVPLVMDIRWKELPVEYLAALGLIASIFNVAGFGAVSSTLDVQARLASVLLAITLAVMFFGLQILLSRGRWLGLGDVWLGAAMGAILGWPLLGVAVYLAYLLGGSLAIAGLLSGRLRRGDLMPFAPALISGLVLSLWYGPYLLQWFHAMFP